MTRIDSLFPHFPSQQFISIELGDELELFQEKLNTEGFKLKAEQSNHYINKELEAELVLPELGGSDQFKVFLFAEQDLEASEDIKDFFSKSAVAKNVSNDFSIFEFETQTKDFSITLFQQSDFLRLHFELKTTH